MLDIASKDNCFLYIDMTYDDFQFFFRVHYTEYLCSLVFRSNVDPVSLLDLGELKQVFARANHFMPKQRPGEYEFQYKKRLAQVLK